MNFRFVALHKDKIFSREFGDQPSDRPSDTSSEVSSVGKRSHFKQLRMLKKKKKELS